MVFPSVKIVQLRVLCFNICKSYLKSCEKNKNGVGRENRGIDDIEMAACNEGSFTLFNFLCIFLEFTTIKKQKQQQKPVMSLSGAEEVTIRGQEEATQDEAPHSRRATREVDSE